MLVQVNESTGECRQNETEVCHGVLEQGKQGAWGFKWGRLMGLGGLGGVGGGWRGFGWAGRGRRWSGGL